LVVVPQIMDRVTSFNRSAFHAG